MTHLPSMFRTAASNAMAWSVGLQGIAALRDAGVECLVFKSLPQVEELYGHAGGRPSTDVDLLIRRESAEPAFDILLGEGWQVVDGRSLDFLTRRLGRDVARGIRPWLLGRSVGEFTSIIDLHFDDPRPKWTNPVLTDAVWERASPEVVDGVDVLTLSEEDRLLLLCWHLIRHHMSAAHLRDIQILLERGTEYDEAYLARRALECGVVGAVSLSLRLATRTNARSLSLLSVMPRISSRQRFMQQFYLRHAGELGRARGRLFSAAMMDDISEGAGMLRQDLLPSRVEIGAGYLGRVPSRLEYSAEVTKVYIRRLVSRI